MNHKSEKPSVLEIARMIDHSLLHPTTTDAETRAGLDLARDCQCATACVKPYSVPLAAEMLAGSGVGVCAVAGFPHGNSHIRIKAMESQIAIGEGATEIDVVVNIGKALGGDWNYIRSELSAVNSVCLERGAILKVIFENDFLEESHIARLCELCTEAKVAFVKTSTGYGFVKQPSGQYAYVGATLPHLKLMRQRSGPAVQVKAAGGIRTLDELLAARSLGVSRIGASATKAILTEAVQRGFPGPIPSGLKAGASGHSTEGY